MNHQRVKDIVWEFDGTEQRVHVSFSRDRQPDRFITTIEEAFSCAPSELCLVSGMDLSAEKDLTRQKSKRVTTEAGCKQINIPRKGLVCLQITVACPLNNIILARRYASTSESIYTVIKTFLSRRQGLASDSLLNFSFTSTIYI